MSKELIEKLRRAIIRPFDLNPVADRIEELEAERDRLTKRVAELEMLYNYVFDRAKEITAERDELMAVLKEVKGLSAATAATIIDAAIAKGEK